MVAPIVAVTAAATSTSSVDGRRLHKHDFAGALARVVSRKRTAPGPAILGMRFDKITAKTHDLPCADIAHRPRYFPISRNQVHIRAGRFNFPEGNRRVTVIMPLVP